MRTVYRLLCSLPYKKGLFAIAALAMMPPAAALLLALSLPGARLLLVVVLAVCLCTNLAALVWFLLYILQPLYQALNGGTENGGRASPLKMTRTMLQRALDYYHSAKTREYNILLLQKQAEIDALQSQINPHFLHNTLESIRGQALEEDACKTSDMVESLSRFLRYTISQKNDMISLAKELESVQNYMKIQRYRFADRFDLFIHLEKQDEHILKYRIPKLTLQPLIENAIYHGLDKVATGGRIEITCTLTQSRLVLEVADNGCGMTETELEKLNSRLQAPEDTEGEPPVGQRTGVALHNVNARIKLVYGAEYGLALFSMPGVGTQVEIVLPLQENAYEI